jgi:hypothetical protein
MLPLLRPRVGISSAQLVVAVLLIPAASSTTAGVAVSAVIPRPNNPRGLEDGPPDDDDDNDNDRDVGG